jgi:Cu/Ag efflux protein CusF
MFVTSTTVGYGDIGARTHLGRFAAVSMGITGIISAALLTASLANALEWSPQEMSALLVLERQKAREDVRAIAVNRIIYWWRIRQVAKSRTQMERKWWHLLAHMTDLYHDYQMWRLNRGESLMSIVQKCSVDVESLSSEAKKVDLIHTKVKYLQLGLQSLKYTVKANNEDETVKIGAGEEHYVHTLFRHRTELRIEQDLRRQQKQQPSQVTVCVCMCVCVCVSVCLPACLRVLVCV